MLDSLIGARKSKLDKLWNQFLASFLILSFSYSQILPISYAAEYSDPSDGVKDYRPTTQWADGNFDPDKTQLPQDPLQFLAKSVNLQRTSSRPAARPEYTQEISVSTNETGEKNLFISLNPAKKAGKVTWNGKIYQVVLDPKTNNYTVKVSKEETWTFHISDNQLVSFKIGIKTKTEQKTTQFLFNSTGLLDSKETETVSGSQIEKTRSNYSYLSMNGKTYVETMAKLDQSQAQDGSNLQVNQTKTFYQYSDSGALIGTIHISIDTQNGKTQGNAHYQLDDLINFTQTNVSITVKDEVAKNLFNELNGLNGYGLIDSLALLKNVTYFSNESYFGDILKFTIESLNVSGKFTAKKTMMADGSVFMVRGAPDVFGSQNGFSKDVLIKSHQIVKGYDVYYGPAYDSEGNFANYGLAFSKENELVVITQQLLFAVMLNGLPYRIKTYPDGNITLDAFPVLNPVGDQVLTETSEFSLTFGGTDEENGPLTYGIYFTNMSALPAGASFDPSTRTFSWTPNYEQAGEYTATVFVSDGISSDTEKIKFNVQNLNRIPTARTQDLEAVAGNPLEIILGGQDLDRDQLSYHVTVPPQYGTIMSKEGYPDRLFYTPNAENTGLDEFYFKVFDGQDWSEEVKITIDILSQVHTFQSVPVFEWITSQQNSVAGTFELASGNPDDSYLFQILDWPDHGTLTINGNEYVYTPHERYYGSDSFAFFAKNTTTGEHSAVTAANILGLYGLSQTAVVIDTGIDYTHQALGGGFGSDYRVVDGWDFSTVDGDPLDDGRRGRGHGTHVAGIIGSSDPTYAGVAPLVDLAALKVFNPDAANAFGAASWTWIEEALQWVVEKVLEQRNAIIGSIQNPITVVNLSLGGHYNLEPGMIPFEMMEDELKTLHDLGITVVAATGNDFEAGPSPFGYKNKGLAYLASSPYVIPAMSLGGPTIYPETYEDRFLDNLDALSFFTQRHPAAIAADGWAVKSAVPLHADSWDGVLDGFTLMSGTSMAAPFVAGASILIREAFQFLERTNLDQDFIYQHMRNTADVVFDAFTETHYLNLNLNRAIEAVFHPELLENLDFPELRELPAVYASAVSAAASVGGELITMAFEVFGRIQTEIPKTVSKVRMLDYSVRKATSIKVEEKSEDEVLKIKKQKRSTSIKSPIPRKTNI